jgi:hypothetical protein
MRTHPSRLTSEINPNTLPSKPCEENTGGLTAAAPTVYVVNRVVVTVVLVLLVSTNVVVVNVEIEDVDSPVIEVVVSV